MHQNFDNQAPGPDEPRLIACLGSSSTRGKGQAFDWISELQRRPCNANLAFKNFGIGGDLAYNALARLPALIECKPSQVLVWLGANDALALVSKKFRRIFSFAKRLPRSPSPEWFRENLLTIAQRLRRETAAEVGLCSLPPIGEDLASRDPFQAQLNQTIEGFSAIVAGIAHETGCRYIPLRERLAAEIRTNPGQPYTAFKLLPFYLDAFRVVVFGQSPEAVATRNGWRFHTDGVHLNRRAGLLVADCIQEFISR